MFSKNFKLEMKKIQKVFTNTFVDKSINWIQIFKYLSMAAVFHVFQLSPGSLKLSESLDIVYPSERQELTECH